MTTLAEDLVLLLLDPDTGKPIVDSASLDHAIGGALLLDLSLLGRVTPDDSKLVAVAGKPIGDPLLDDALDRLSDGPVRAKRAVERLAKKTRRPVLDRLAARKVIEGSEGKVLGLFPTTTWTVLDRAPGDALRARLAQVLLKGVDPDQHLACLVSLIHAVKAEHKLVDGPKRELRARAEEITQGEWAGEAVRKAVQSVQMSVAVAVSVVAVAGSAGNS